MKEHTFVNALAAFQVGEFEQAQLHVREILRKEPTNIQAKSLLGQIARTYSNNLYAEEISRVNFSPKLLVANSDDQKQLFKDSISYINLETSSFCNRSCSFCPVPQVGRNDKGSMKFMDDALFESIVSDLKSIDYQGSINFFRFNEPLADPRIIEKVKYCRSNLPNVKLIIFTNGDRLTGALADKLCDAGCNVVRISFYLKEIEAYKSDNIAFDLEIERRMTARLEQLGFPFEIHKKIPGSCEATIFHPDGMGMFMVGRNYYNQDYKIDRGGVVDSCDPGGVRTSPCLSPFYTFDIDYQGNVLPCCNLLGDMDKHSKYIVGRVEPEAGSIFKVFASKKAVGWRKSLLSFEPKSKPCDTCSYLTVCDTPENRQTISSWRVEAGLEKSELL